MVSAWPTQDNQVYSLHSSSAQILYGQKHSLIPSSNCDLGHSVQVIKSPISLIGLTFYLVFVFIWGWQLRPLCQMAVHQQRSWRSGSPTVDFSDGSYLHLVPGWFLWWHFKSFSIMCFLYTHKGKNAYTVLFHLSNTITTASLIILPYYDAWAKFKEFLCHCDIHPLKICFKTESSLKN